MGTTITNERRHMAGTTPGAKGRAARQVQARELARSRAARFAVREQRLQELAAAYFVVQGAVAEATADAERQIAQVRADLEYDLREHQEDAGEVIRDMLKAGASVAETAERLGLPQGAVRRVKPAAGAGRNAGDGADGAAPAAAAALPGQAAAPAEGVVAEAVAAPVD